MTTTSLPRRIAVIGVGLVGGSLVRALHGHQNVSVVAIDADPATRQALEREALADVILAAPTDALFSCDVVVLATPIAAIESMLSEVSAAMRDGAVLTDVGGVKSSVLAAARAGVRSEVSFVGAHPMFGGELGGFASSRADRWRGVVAVCTDDANERDIAQIEAMHRALGAEVVRCTAEEHDAAVALVSHLPYVVASALSLVARDAGPLAKALAGQGFVDATRLASFAYDVQGEVARRNPSLPRAIDRMHDALLAIAGSLSESSESARIALESARAAKKSF